MVAHNGASANVERGLAHHRSAGEMLEEFAELARGDAPLEDPLEELAEEIDRHLAQEERELFPLAATLLDEHEQEQLARRHDLMWQRMTA